MKKVEILNEENTAPICNEERIRIAIVMKIMIDTIQMYKELDKGDDIKAFIMKKVGLTSNEYDQIEKFASSRKSNLLIESTEQVIPTIDVQDDATISWEVIKSSFDFSVIRNQAKIYSRLEFNSIEEIEEEFDESDIFNLCNMIINSCTISK